MKKVALGLSGGVDSAVAAHLLKRQGYDVHCIYLNCFDKDIPGCKTKRDRKDALSIALHLKLSFLVLDFRKEYQATVIDYFRREYEAGRTPNPDVVCNRDIKFGLFWDWAVAQEHFDFLATGHYASIKHKGESIIREFDSVLSLMPYALIRPKDERKDQTYFLWQVPRERFARVLFPLGDYLKSEVREIARDAKLPVSEKKDSTGICFIGEVRVEDFLKRIGVKERYGDVVDTTGRVIGRHKGVMFYTTGQRHGFEIFGKTGEGDRTPLYVINKDIERNRLVVGFGAECYRSQFTVTDCNWLALLKDGPSDSGRTVLCRIRHGGELISCRLESITNQQINVFLSSPQRGVAPGQSAVFYTEDGVVLGGGIIELSESRPEGR